MAGNCNKCSHIAAAPQCSISWDAVFSISLKCVVVSSWYILLNLTAAALLTFSKGFLNCPDRTGRYGRWQVNSYALLVGNLARARNTFSKYVHLSTMDSECRWNDTMRCDCLLCLKRMMKAWFVFKAGVCQINLLIMLLNSSFPRIKKLEDKKFHF